HKHSSTVTATASPENAAADEGGSLDSGEGFEGDEDFGGAGINGLASRLSFIADDISQPLNLLKVQRNKDTTFSTDFPTAT
ncbi:hypothetical protein Tco_1086449, partial [Tanacetum coccineum]